MQTQSKDLFAPLNESEVNGLTSETKETLVPGYNNGHRKNFSAAELWNIQRQHKTINPVRRFVY